jgi:hypothetical protein
MFGALHSVGLILKKRSIADPKGIAGLEGGEEARSGGRRKGMEQIFLRKRESEDGDRSAFGMGEDGGERRFRGTGVCAWRWPSSLSEARNGTKEKRGNADETRGERKRYGEGEKNGRKMPQPTISLPQTGRMDAKMIGRHLLHRRVVFSQRGFG